MINNFYVYRHIRLDTNVPFYIGASNQTKYTRAYNIKDRTKKFKEIYSTTETKVEIILDGLSIDEAAIKESEFISLYGRIRDGGTLINVCRKMPMQTNETKQKISDSAKERIFSEETKQKISNSKKGVLLSEKHKQKLSDAKKKSGVKPPSQKGVTRSRYTKQKMSDAKKGIPKSEAHKQKVSELMKEYWILKKNNKNL